MLEGSVEKAVKTNLSLAASRVTRLAEFYDLKNVFAKNGDNIVVFAETYATFCIYLIITLVFKKSSIFCVENCRKLQKFVIITSTPDWPNFRLGMGRWFLPESGLKITEVVRMVPKTC
jgi:hypothetical protein